MQNISFDSEGNIKDEADISHLRTGQVLEDGY
jgi:hypothetical protein